MRQVPEILPGAVPGNVASTEKTRSFHIKTFGCQMNVYDSDRMVRLLESKGYRFEPELQARADVILHQYLQHSG